MDPLFVIPGFLTAVLVSMTGVGGGALMTPVLILCGVDPVTAVGTDLAYAAFTKAFAVPLHHQRGNVNWSLVMKMCAGSVPVALLTLWFINRFGIDDDAYGQLVTSVLGAALVLTAVVILLRPRLSESRASLLAATIFSSTTQSVGTLLLTVLSGATIGLLVTISSVGAGVVGAAILLLIYPKLVTSRIVGTDLAHALILAGIAAIGYWHRGSVDSGILIPLLIGSVPGVWCGALFSDRISGPMLRSIMATIMMSVGIGFFIKNLLFT